MLIGYARLTTHEQNPDLQVNALKKAGCERVLKDKISGNRMRGPSLGKALEMLCDGDTLVVWKLNRLGCSVKGLVDLVVELLALNVQFMSLSDAIDTGTPSGRSFFDIMASLAEMERELTSERMRVGMAEARKLGRTGGRKRKMTDGKIALAKKLLANGVPARNVAMRLGVSVPTLYRWIPASTPV